MQSHAQPGQPGNTADPTPAEMKLCQTCRALYPVSHYGASKMSPKGLNVQCKECRAQYLRLRRQVKYGSISKVDDSTIRSVLHQNQHVLSIASQLDTSTCDFECRGFSTKTKVDYKVFIGRSPNLGMSCICVFSMDGSMIREMAYSGALSNITEELTSFLRVLNIRLELTEVDAISSKNTIYYI